MVELSDINLLVALIFTATWLSACRFAHDQKIDGPYSSSCSRHKWTDGICYAVKDACIGRIGEIFPPYRIDGLLAKVCERAAWHAQTDLLQRSWSPATLQSLRTVCSRWLGAIGSATLRVRLRPTLANAYSLPVDSNKLGWDWTTIAGIGAGDGYRI